MNTRPHFLLAAIFLLVVAPCCTQAFDIAKDGKPVAVIATGANPPATSVFAAKELAGYLGRMCGGAFEVVEGDAPAGRPCILVGAPCDVTAFDGIRLRVKDGILDVTGQQPRGPLYAVYELLERLGCGFWANDNESVPERKDITVADDLSYDYAPPFTLRYNIGTTATYNPRWCPKARLNGNRGTPKEMGGNYFVDMGESTLGLTDGELCRETFAVHPDWYAYSKAKRERVPQQVCMTNPKVLEKVVELAGAIMEKTPNREFLACSYADVPLRCQCPACDALVEREGSPSALLLNVVNYLARAMAADYPNLTITFLAYNANSIKPPANMPVEPNVACVFANIWRNYAVPPPPTGNLARWCELTRNRVYIWDYGAMFNNYIMPTPTVDLHGPTMRVYRDLKCPGVFAQLSQDETSDCIDLSCWLYGKMAWNPDQDEWKLIDQWCDGALGAGAPFLKQWLRMEAEYRPNIKVLGHAEADNRVCLTPELLLRGNALFLDALDAVKGDERRTRQLEQMYGSILSVMVERYNFDIGETAKQLAATNAAEAARLHVSPLPTREDYYLQFERTCKKFKCGWLGEFEGSACVRIHHGEILRVVRGKKRFAPPWTFQNPVSKIPVQDPFVTWDAKAGCYYLLYTCGDQVEIRRGKNAAGLADSNDRSVAWRPPSKNAPVSGNITAPELHCGRDGKWYIYASGSDGMTIPTGSSSVEDTGLDEMGLGDDLMGVEESLKGNRSFTDMIQASENRLFVLQSKTDDPFGGFEFKGILDKTVSALDPTVFADGDGTLYMCYAQQAAGTKLVMRKMKDNLSFDPASMPVVVVNSHGTADVFEAPTVLARDGRLFLVYSCFGRWSNAGMMKICEYAGKDIARASSWNGRAARNFLVPGNKLNSMAEQKDRFAQCLGPGHASFFTSPDGTELWCAYHGMQRPNAGTGPADVYLFIQRVDFADDGSPDMGKPEIAGENPENKSAPPTTCFIIPSGELWTPIPE